MLSAGGITPFRKLFENYLVEQAEARIRALIREKHTPPPPMPVGVLANYSAGAAVKVLAWWLEQKNPPPAVEMARNVTQLLFLGILNVL